MAKASIKTLLYRRAHFVTQLPVSYRYSASHAWVARQGKDLWRVGFTKFATRMLGEAVDHHFEVEPRAPVQPGQIIGWVEGFKAISDLYCLVRGRFVEGNPDLKLQNSLINLDPYISGWLYAVKGEPDDKTMDVHAYRDLLDETINRLRKQREAGKK
jgi:glycine cleavage system H protein